MKRRYEVGTVISLRKRKPRPFATIMGVFAIYLALLALTSHFLDRNVVYAQSTGTPIMVVQHVEAPVEVKDSFPPILKAIASCESGGQQFENGHPILGHKSPSDIGYMQINRDVWQKQADELGYDLTTLEGNKAMGVWILEHRGTRDWSASAHCWLKKS